MLIEAILKHIPLIIIKQKCNIQKILILISPFVLLFGLKSYNFQYTSNFLLKTQKPLLFNNILDYPKSFEKMGPNKTICIVLEKNLQKEGLEFIINHFKPRVFSVIITKKDIKENFFIKIYIKKSKSDFLEICPLVNFQCCLGTLIVLRHIFGGKMKFYLKNFFGGFFNHSVNLCLKGDEKSFYKLLLFLRYCMNLDRITGAYYYYIPFSKFYFSGEIMFIFIILIVSISLLDNNFSLGPSRLFIMCLLFHISPIFCLFLLISANFPLYIIPFSLINHKFTFFFCIIKYFHILYNYKKKYIIKSLK